MAAKALKATTPVTRRRDWFRILSELDTVGCTNAVVARKLGVAKNAVYGWKMGADPAHAMGETLLALHRVCCGEEMADALARDEAAGCKVRAAPAPGTPEPAQARGPAQADSSTGLRAREHKWGRRGSH
jgi:hypothetical protein